MPAPSRRWPVVLVLTASTCAGIGVLGGCQRSLFAGSDRQPRTQFETYDRMRQRYVPVDEPDVFGNPQPALRERLSRAQ